MIAYFYRRKQDSSSYSKSFDSVYLEDLSFEEPFDFDIRIHIGETDTRVIRSKKFEFMEVPVRIITEYRKGSESFCYKLEFNSKYHNLILRDKLVFNIMAFLEKEGWTDLVDNAELPIQLTDIQEYIEDLLEVKVEPETPCMYLNINNVLRYDFHHENESFVALANLELL